VTYICGIKLDCVINTGHSDLTLANHGVVIGVGGDKRHFCGDKTKMIITQGMCTFYVKV